MGRPKKIKPEVKIDLKQMRGQISDLIRSFNFSYLHSNSEQYNRNKATEIAEAVRRQFGKYFTITEEISGPDMRPPYYVSWKVEEKV